MRAIASALALLVIGIGILGWGGWNYDASTTGEKTTAVVDQCTKTYGRKGRSRTTCYGTWQSNGVAQRGQIEGVGDDDEGKSVAVRIHDGEAYAFSWAGVLVPAVIGGILLIASLVWVGSAFRSKSSPQQQAYGRPPHPYYPPAQPHAAPPGYPHPGYPPAGYPPPGYPPPGYPHAQQPPPGYRPAQYPPPGYAPAQYPPPGYPPPGYQPR